MLTTRKRSELCRKPRQCLDYGTLPLGLAPMEGLAIKARSKLTLPCSERDQSHGMGTFRIRMPQSEAACAGSRGSCNGCVYHRWLDIMGGWGYPDPMRAQRSPTATQHQPQQEQQP